MIEGSGVGSGFVPLMDPAGPKTSGSATSFKVVLFDSTVSEDAEIKPRTVATSALSVRRSSHSARTHPHSVPVRKLQFLM
jgi:hypothetical protein